ncbi:MAG TPA: hypothetical protein VFI31_30055 [Pirellulales bacterium]|nr:hypothetical protein [Pirellulales bacterium]
MEFKRHSFILAVIDALHDHGSWTGKTHVQKALSLLHDAGEVEVPFKFVLYKHGPYSFDVEEELEQVQSYGAVAIDTNVRGYGVVLHSGKMANYAREAAPLSADEQAAIERVCAFVGQKNVVELERLATAAWIRRREKLDTTEKVVGRLRKLKPHVTAAEAACADAEAARWLQTAQSHASEANGAHAARR